MAVYVDRLRTQGRKTWCHLWADSEKELFRMAERLRRPVKNSDKDRYMHLDLNDHDRDLAIRYGAIPVDKY